MTLDARVSRVDAVAIGASAGGVEAMLALLPALPADLAASVFVVLHLPRERPSLLVEIFQPRCLVPVREAQDKDIVEPGVVYVAPPDYHLLVDAGPQLALSDDEPVHFSRPSVDVLFESAADVYGHRMMGIVLTGSSQDGAAGLTAIHQAGGVTVVQRPNTALVPFMAEAALSRQPADFVLSLDELWRLLESLKKRNH